MDVSVLPSTLVIVGGFVDVSVLPSTMSREVLVKFLRGSAGRALKPVPEVDH